MIHKGDNMKQKASAKETENEKATEEEKISETIQIRDSYLKYIRNYYDSIAKKQIT